MFCFAKLMKSIFSGSLEDRKDPLKSNDPYAILDVSRRSSLKEIKLARKRILQQHHPDRKIGDSEASRAIAIERSKKANWAYLMIKKRRKGHHRPSAA